MTAQLTCGPVYRNWGNVGLLHVYDYEIVPGARYDIQAISLGRDIEDEGNYSGPASIFTSQWGDIVGDCATPPCTPPNGVVDFIDITGVVDKFRNLPTAPKKSRADLASDLVDLKIDFVDISHCVDAFRGLPYPFDGPTGCPPVQKSTVSAPLRTERTPTNEVQATITLRPSATQVCPGDSVEIDVFGTNVANLRFYQVALDVRGGRYGEVTREDVRVDKERVDYIFGSARAIAAADLVEGRLGATLMAGTVDVDQPGYLGTFTFRAAAKANGLFNVFVRLDGSTFFGAARMTPIAFKVGDPATIMVTTQSRLTDRVNTNRSMPPWRAQKRLERGASWMGRPDCPSWAVRSALW